MTMTWDAEFVTGDPYWHNQTRWVLFSPGRKQAGYLVGMYIPIFILFHDSAWSCASVVGALQFSITPCHAPYSNLNPS